MTTCTKCGVTKAIDEFYRQSPGGGPRSRCKACMGAYDSERRKTHPPKLDPVLRAARTKRWLDKNPGWTARYSRERYRSDPDRLNQHRRKGGKYYDNVVALVHKRRARLMGAEGSHTRAEWEAVLAEHGRRCLACGSTEHIVRDHVVPLVQGGSNYTSNLQPLCRSCNARKATKIIDYR